MSFSSKIREALEKANADLIECKEELRLKDNKIISLESELARFQYLYLLKYFYILFILYSFSYISFIILFKL